MFADNYNVTLENLGECNNLYADNIQGVLRYYCKLTNALCIADKYGPIKTILHGKSSINRKILKRCPSRKEISDVVEERGDSQ